MHPKSHRWLLGTLKPGPGRFGGSEDPPAQAQGRAELWKGGSHGRAVLVPARAWKRIRLSKGGRGEMGVQKSVQDVGTVLREGSQKQLQNAN